LGGIIGVTAIAFSCSTEFIPEINEQMKLVKFTDGFKTTMTATMIVDYVGCWVVEVVLKWLFSDYRARDIADRRPDQLERERARKAVEKAVKDEVDEKMRLAKVAEFERKVEERRQKIQAWSQGRRDEAQVAAT